MEKTVLLWMALHRKRRVAGACALALLTFGPDSGAQMAGGACTALTADGGLPPTLVIAGPTPAQGSSAPLALAQALTGVAGAGVSVLYVQADSCSALGALANALPTPSAALQIDGTSATPCTFSLGAAPDLVISEIYPDTFCPVRLPTDHFNFDFLGPVQAMAFAVPQASPEKSISADAAYTVFGFGGMAPYAVSPWTNSLAFLVPEATSGPLMLTASGIGLAPGKWTGAAPSPVAATDAIKKYLTTFSANAALGVIPLADAESDPADIRILAYQHTGQRCGYLPNSDANHADRINVRQGRYGLWGPLHFVTRVDDPSTDNPLDRNGNTNSALSSMVAAIEELGKAPPSASSVASLDDASSPAVVQLFAAEITAGLVPWCAMQVTRSGSADFGPESSWAPPEPCGCAFEYQAGSNVSGRCATCTTSADCPSASPQCRFGYCESR